MVILLLVKKLVIVLQERKDTFTQMDIKEVLIDTEKLQVIGKKKMEQKVTIIIKNMSFY